MLSASALVMWRVLGQLKPDRVAFSALGLREGWLYAQLGRDEQNRDPLIEGHWPRACPTRAYPSSAKLWRDEPRTSQSSEMNASLRMAEMTCGDG